MDSFINLVKYLLPYAITGGVLSPFIAMFNKAVKAQKSGVKFAVAFMFVATAAIVHGFMTFHSPNPKIIAAQTALISFFSSAIWLTVFKPVFNYLEAAFTKAAAFDATVQSAAAPVVTVTPVETVN